jgi:hypothetical protein
MTGNGLSTDSTCTRAPHFAAIRSAAAYALEEVADPSVATRIDGRCAWSEWCVAEAGLAEAGLAEAGLAEAFVKEFMSSSALSGKRRVRCT